MENNDSTPRDLFDGIGEDNTPRDPATGEPITVENNGDDSFLFDGLGFNRFSDPDQQPTTKKDIPADEWVELVDFAEQMQATAKAAGVWHLTPPKELIQRGEVFFNQRVEALRDTMSKHDAPNDVIMAVCVDYAALLSGVVQFTATPIQVQSALHSITPYEAFTIDRYGLYYGLLLNYMRFVLKLNYYRQDVKGDQATDATRHNFLHYFPSFMEARAVRWLVDKEVVDPGDFADFNPVEVYTYFKQVDELTDAANYVLYYVVARTALVASPEELAAIKPPESTYFSTIGPLSDFAERITRDTVNNLTRAAEDFAGAVTADTSTEREQARQAGKDWSNPANNRPVKIYENYGVVLSRPVEVSPNGEIIKNTLPVRRYIEDFNANPSKYTNYPIRATVTEMTLQKVVAGLNLLLSLRPKFIRRGEDGRLIVDTNLSELSRYCGYQDANQEQKQALLGGLLLLDPLFVVVDKPPKKDTNAKGKKKSTLTGGRQALRFLFVRSIGIDTGDLIFEIFPESLTGHASLITPETYKQLRAEAKGLTQSRFNYQVATKSHKSERDLIDEVFGYADRLKYATPEEMADIKREIQKHRNRAQKKLLGWFDDYIKAGIITEFKRVPSKETPRDYVLSWKCADPSKLTPQPVNPDDEIAGEQ